MACNFVSPWANTLFGQTCGNCGWILSVVQLLHLLLLYGLARVYLFNNYYIHSGVLMHIIESPHPPPVQPPLLVMKQSLINCRQHEAFIKVLMVC